MLARLGFVASVLSQGLSTSRTCRLKNATPERLHQLTEENLASLAAVLNFLDAHRIRLYRISSNIVPFGSHRINAVSWWDEHAARLEALARRIRHLGTRVSTHPGQYTVLNSPSEAVVDAAIAELVYQARLLDALEVDNRNKIVVHVGGLYGGDKQVAMDRFVAVASRLPAAVLQRLVVENDDRLFDAADALSVARRLRIPVVFDWLHHQANRCGDPIEQLLPRIFDTWTAADGRPKVHMSSQAEGKLPGAHADYVSVGDVEAFLAVAPPVPFDCMLEAKQKERALLQLRDELRHRHIVESDA
jgi:UV DNA damage endonuclease